MAFARIVVRLGDDLGLHPGQAAERLPRFSRQIPLPATDPMDAMLGQVRAAYGPASARFVALQLEHPLWQAAR